MKKVILLSTLYTICSFSVSAQKKQPLSLTLGPKLGVNYSTLATKNKSVSDEYILGYQAGGFIRVSKNKTYIQPELYFTSKGSNLVIQDNAQGGSGSVNGKVRFSNVDIPVLIGKNLINNEHFKFRLAAGPMLSFNLKTNDDGLTEMNPGRYQFKDRIWGVQGGLGVDVGNICVDLRYETGLNKINEDLGQRPSAFNFSVGFKLF